MTDVVENLMEEIVKRSTGGACSLAREEYADGWRPLNCEPSNEMPLGDDWFFNMATDDEARQILSEFLAGRLEIGFELACQVARLLAERGYVVKNQLEEVVANTDWSSYGAPQLALAGLPYLSDGEATAIRLLDVVPEDNRDGIFIACWKFKARSVQLKVFEKFNSWVKSPAWGRSTGEGPWLGQFIAKWLNESTFDLNMLHDVTSWYFINFVRQE